MDVNGKAIVDERKSGGGMGARKGARSRRAGACRPVE